MRVHGNRDLFVKVQQNAQRHKLSDLITRCPQHIVELLSAAKQISFPGTSDLLKRHLPISNDGFGASKIRPDTYQFLEVSDPADALEQFEGSIAGFENSAVHLSLGELGGMSFGEEHFVDLDLPMFAAKLSHWSGHWSELFELGGHCMAMIAEDSSFGIIVDSYSGGSAGGRKFEIGLWNEVQAS